MLPGATVHDGSPVESLDTLARVLGAAVRAIEAHGLPYVLLGGIASAVHGRPRCSSDVDLLVRPDVAPLVLGTLGRAGFRTEETNPVWIFKAFKDGVLIDVLFRLHGDIYLDDEMLRRSRPHSFRGTQVRVISPEDLVLIKAVAHDEQTPRHWGDALGLLTAPDLDWEYLLERSRRGARRLASLLFYAASIDVCIPRDVLRRLTDRILE